ncbi:MAG: HEAT repeat domain-containing protein [Pseudomonadota bacterium]
MVAVDVEAPVQAGASNRVLPLVVAALDDRSDVVRCAAARVLAILGDQTVAERLVDALLDEDPDLRVDAMGALVRCARPQDADAVLESLTGDPETDVKRAAIRVLAKLKHQASLPIISALAKDRCEEEIAWQNDTIGWDEWNDIQPEAIDALGELGSEEAVSALCEVHASEWGAEFEPSIFAALARIPGTGVQTLTNHAMATEGRPRARAFAALSKADPSLLEPLVPVLKDGEDVDGRLLAVRALADDQAALADMALRDPAASVRRAALEALSPPCYDTAFAALSDEDETVRAAALDQLRLCESGHDNADILANVEAWAGAADTRLACACVGYLTDQPGPNSLAVLTALAENVDRPQEVRVDALRGLATFDDSVALDTLASMIIDPTRQVRLAALTSLAAIARSEQAELANAATDFLCQAMNGAIQAPMRDGQGSDDGSDDLAAPKMEGTPSGRITITPDGDIVDADDDAMEEAEATSTLNAIQSSAPVEQPQPHKKRGKRVAVDGPNDVSTDIRVLAYGVAGDNHSDVVALALAQGVQSSETQLRTAVFDAIARRADGMALESQLVQAAISALADEDPFIRGKAAHAVAKGAADPGSLLGGLARDSDAIVRAIAVGELAQRDSEIAIQAMQDPSPLVRGTALDALISSKDTDALADGVAGALVIGATDTLCNAADRSPVGRDALLACLSDTDRSTKDRMIALQAIADTDPACWQVDSRHV